VFLTIWDGGGTDTYDLSNYQSDVSIDLEPGHWTTTSPLQLATLDIGHPATGNVANALLYQDNPSSLIENATGGSGSDILAGNYGANALTGGRGNDQLDGAPGVDTAVYSGARANYNVTSNADGSWTVVDTRAGSPDGTDTLLNMELLQFSDSTMDLGAQQPPPQVQPPPPPPPPSGEKSVVTEISEFFFHLMGVDDTALLGANLFPDDMSYS
jgi:serralysin